MADSETGLSNSRASGSLWDMTGRVPVVTFIGAGGKTTCLRSLTQEIISAGKPVIATTTTKVFPEDSMKAWKNPNPPFGEQAGAYFWYVDMLEEKGKWIGPCLSSVDAAIGRAGIIPNLQDLHWVIEGDGARELKLKCWEPHEPQIPRRSDCVVLVLDGGLWRKILQAEQVHRPAVCLDLLGHVWNAEQAWCYFLRSPVFAPRYGQMSWVILMNIHGRNAENEDLVEPLKCLHDLRRRWIEIQREIKDLEYLPKHLRIATGDAKEGKLQWFDLW